MEESMGPYESKCPVGILDMLTELPPPDLDEAGNPKENGKLWARQWRQRCRDYHAVKRNQAKLAKTLAPGAVLAFKEPLSFGKGVFEASRFELVDKARGHYRALFDNGRPPTAVKLPRTLVSRSLLTGHAAYEPATVLT